MYRIKELNKLKTILNPVLDLIEIYIDEQGFLRKIGTDTDDNEDDNGYIVNSDSGKRLLMIENELQFHFYKDNRETCELFNPFIKFKNTAYLLLLVLPVIYMRYCKTIDSNNTEDMSFGILDYQYEITKEDLENHINILQYPKTKDGTVKFECICKNMNGDTVNFTFSSDNKIISTFALLLQMVEFFDTKPKFIIEKHIDSDDDLYIYIDNVLELYIKEQELNKKEIIKNSAIDSNNIDVSHVSMLENEEEEENNGDDEIINIIDSINGVNKIVRFDYDHENDATFENLDFS